MIDPALVRGVSGSVAVRDQVQLMLVGRKGERGFTRVDQDHCAVERLAASGKLQEKSRAA